MIQLQNLTAGYQGRAVVKNVSLDLLPGQVLALLGPNGSGKSTLVKAALGLIAPMEGAVLYDGADIRRLKRKQIAQMAAFLTQSRDTPSIEALRMVLHGRFPYLSWPRQYAQQDYAMARAAMDAADCRQYEAANVGQLSGGQRQSVYLAMALAQNAQTIFMDEPTTYLDIRHQLHTIRTARSLAAQGRAVVLILHDIPLALRGADRVGVLSGGRLELCAPPDQVYHSGVLSQVFGVEVCRVDTPHGPQYFCIPEEE